MSRKAPTIILSAAERVELDTWVRGRNLPHRQVIRARIVTMAADGLDSQDIAEVLGISRPAVQV